MKIEIVGKNIEITDGIKIAIENSLNEFDKYFTNKELYAHVNVRTYPIGQKIEITLTIDAGHTLRQEEVHENLYAAIDIAGKKLEQKIRRFKDRINSNKKKADSIAVIFSSHEHEKTEEKKVIRRKTIENKPMTESEAILQFEMSGYDFYIFEDVEEEKIKILYNRKDGEYGMMEFYEE